MKKSRLTAELFEKKKSEAEIQQAIAELLIKMGYLVIRFNSGGKYMNGNFVKFYTIINNRSSSGLPDLAFMRNNKLTFVEVKAARGRTTDTQKEFRELAASYGMEIIVASGWQELYEQLSNKHEHIGTAK